MRERWAGDMPKSTGCLGACVIAARVNCLFMACLGRHGVYANQMQAYFLNQSVGYPVAGSSIIFQSNEHNLYYVLVQIRCVHWAK